MKKIKCVYILILILTSCSLFKKNNDSDAPYFKVEVEQNGAIQPEVDDVIVLEKKPFLFRLTYYKTKDIFVHASWERSYFDFPDNKDIFKCKDEYYEGCLFVPLKTSAEENFNEDKDIGVGAMYHFDWFYDEKLDWYRMDKDLVIKDGVIYATVTVEYIDDYEKSENINEYHYAVENIEKELYMVFATNRNSEGEVQPHELQREKFMLKFNQE